DTNDYRHGYYPTPALYHATRRHNRYSSGRLRTIGDNLADVIVVTPSHNPPADGGFKYNPPSGGPADTDATSWIADRANQYLQSGVHVIERHPDPYAAENVGRYDFLGVYVDDLPSVLDLEAIRSAGVRIGADPLGGASVAYWAEIAERHRLDHTLVNDKVDPAISFMTLDWARQTRVNWSGPPDMC